MGGGGTSVFAAWDDHIKDILSMTSSKVREHHMKLSVYSNLTPAILYIYTYAVLSIWIFDHINMSICGCKNTLLFYVFILRHK